MSSTTNPQKHEKLFNLLSRSTDCIWRLPNHAKVTLKWLGEHARMTSSLDLSRHGQEAATERWQQDELPVGRQLSAKGAGPKRDRIDDADVVRDNGGENANTELMFQCLVPFRQARLMRPRSHRFPRLPSATTPSSRETHRPSTSESPPSATSSPLRSNASSTRRSTAANAIGLTLLEATLKCSSSSSPTPTTVPTAVDPPAARRTSPSWTPRRSAESPNRVSLREIFPLTTVCVE